MSNLLEQASLVLIPSGYKEDVVYSEIPLDGSGDLQFTRSSNGTRVNSAGLVEVTPWNLAEYSNTFSNGVWVTGGYGNLPTLTANSIANPVNGLTDAWTASFASAGTQGRLLQVFTGLPVGVPYTYSMYVKAGTKTSVSIYSDAASIGLSATFNLSTGVVTSASSGVTATITAMSNGWYYLIITSNILSSGNGQYGIITNPSDDGSVYIYGAQLNIGSTAKPYFPTTDRLNVPRLTYQNGGGGCPSLLLEKQSTNVVLNSEDFSNASWLASNVTVTANQTTSPDGTQNADSLIPNTTNTGIHRVFESAINSIATASYSIFVKPNGYYRVALQECETTGASIGFDLLNQTIITTYSTGGCTASGGKIENMGNGWYRISGIFSFASATNQRLGLYVVSSSWTSGDPASVAWAGNGTSGVYLYGAQVEASSYPTSYIPTTSSSATRVADACLKTGISSLIGQTSGSVFFDFTVDTISAQTNDPVLWYMKDVGAGERYMELYSNGSLVYAEYTTSSIVSIVKSGLTVGRHKCAIAYATDDFVFYVDGVQVGTDTSGTPNGYNTFGLQYYNSNYQGQQKVNQVAIFPTRLTNAELQALTTL